MTDNYDGGLIPKKELVLAVINQLGFLGLKGDGDYLKDTEFLTLSRNVMILADVLVRHTTAARKGKETADSIVSEIRQTELCDEGFRVSKDMLIGIDWLSDYVLDKIEDFTIMQFAEVCIRIDGIVSSNLDKKINLPVNQE